MAILVGGRHRGVGRRAGTVVYASMDARPTSPVSASPGAFFDERAEIRVAFLGRIPEVSTLPSTAAAAQRAFEARVAPRPHEPALNRQVHSTRVVAAADAPSDADGLVDPGPGAGAPLVVFTADCVPVLLGEAGGSIAALHAGWRGLAGGILGEGVTRFDAPSQVTAWIGPSIGACCYEVDDDVALAVARRCDASVIRPGRGQRPHLDLERASRLQLEAAGVRDIRLQRCCTQCASDWHSYRREGPGQGRNHAFIWRAAG